MSLCPRKSASLLFSQSLYRTLSIQTTLHHSRVAHSKAVVGNVVHDDGTGANDTTLADGHAGQDGDTAAQPSVVANGDRIGRLHRLAPVEIVHGMLGRKQLTVRTNEHMVADGDDGSTEKRTIVVDEPTRCSNDRKFGEVSVV